MNIDATSSSRIAAVAAPQTSIQNFTAQQPKKPESEASKLEAPSATKAKNNDKVTIQLEIPQNTLDTLQRVGNVSDLLVSTAKNIRKTDEALTSGATIIANMKEQLGKIIKQYPPFPPESKDRMELLMSYSSLQKQITSLMVPPPPPPVYEKVQHLWDNLFVNQTKSIQTPQLPANVPDSHIKAASEQLNSLQSQVNLVQEALGNSVKTI